MADWNSLREVGEDLTPPAFDSLVRTARSRERRTRIAAVTGALALVAGAAVGIGLTRDDPGPPEPVHDPAPVVELPGGVRLLPDPADGEDVTTLEAGRYRVPLDDVLAIEVDLPDGSHVEGDGLYLSSPTFLLKSEIATDRFGVAKDWCHGDDIVPVGPTFDDLVQAIRTQPGLLVEAPRPVTVGGAPGQYLRVRIDPTVDASPCRDGQINLPGIHGTNNNVTPAYVGDWWVVDAGGRRVVLQGLCDPCEGDPLEFVGEVVRGVSFRQTG